MAVTVAGQWQNAAGLAYNTTPSVPAGLSLPVTVSNTAGDWLFAVCAWRQPAGGAGITVAVDDDARNWWEPISAPNGDSSPLGVARCSVWAAPAARVANTVTGKTTVMIAPDGPVIALAALIIDVAGLLPWLEPAFPAVTAYLLAGTSISLPGATVPAQAFLLTAAASDLSTAAISFSGGAGWTALTGTATANGTDHTSDLELAAQWRVLASTGAAPNPSWSASAACDLSGALTAVIVSAAAPVAPNSNWPAVITELAPGAGVKTPASQIAWQDASHRDLSFSFTQGQPYLLGGLQAGQGALTLDNPDIGLTPPGAGPWAGLDSGTPVRVRGILPSSSTPHYVAFGGFIQQLPTSYDEQLRGVIQATLADVFAYATSSIPPCLQAEILIDQPYAYWPLTDPQGATAASNAAPANPHPLILTASKFNTTGVTAQFGSNSGALKGDSGEGMFSQSGVPGSGVNGFSLACYDSGYPALAGGVTAEIWSQFTATTPSGGDVLTLQNSVINVLECKVSGATMAINTPANSPISLSTINFGATATPLWHLAIAFTRTAYTVYVNGTIAATGTWTTKLPPAFSAVWVNGNWSPFGRAFGQLFNGYSAHCAVFPGLLPAARIQAHYQAGLAAFAGEYAHYRIERLLAYAGLQGRRVIIPEAPGMPGGFSVAASAPPQDTTPMSSMATLGGRSPSLIAPGVPGFTPGSGTQANSALVSAALSTAPALLTVAPTGGPAYVPRGYSSNQPVRWVLGDNTAAGEIPVLPPQFPYDPGYVKNDVALTHPDTGIATSPSVATVQAQSQAQYGDQSYSATAYLQYDATAGNIQAPTIADLANWIASVNATPRLRAGPLTVRASSMNPATVPQAWAFVLGAAPGDMVVVNSRPPTSPGAVISVTARIMQAERHLAYSGNGTDGSIVVTLDAAPEENVLACDDVNRGLLNGNSVIGW